MAILPKLKLTAFMSLPRYFYNMIITPKLSQQTDLKKTELKLKLKKKGYGLLLKQNSIVGITILEKF